MQQHYKINFVTKLSALLIIKKGYGEICSGKPIWTRNANIFMRKMVFFHSALPQNCGHRNRLQKCGLESCRYQLRTFTRVAKVWKFNLEDLQLQFPNFLKIALPQVIAEVRICNCGEQHSFIKLQT